MPSNLIFQKYFNTMPYHICSQILEQFPRLFLPISASVHFTKYTSNCSRKKFFFIWLDCPMDTKPIHVPLLCQKIGKEINHPTKKHYNNLSQQYKNKGKNAAKINKREPVHTWLPSLLGGDMGFWGRIPDLIRWITLMCLRRHFLLLKFFSHFQQYVSIWEWNIK